MGNPQLVTRRSALLLLLLVCALGLLAPSAALASMTLPGFHTAGWNIRCLYLPGARATIGQTGPPSLVCDIATASYALSMQRRCLDPANEQIDWHGFQLVATRKARLLCSDGVLTSESQIPRYVNLPSGHSWAQGPFSCIARTSVTCHSRRGHGLFISRQAWRLW